MAKTASVLGGGIQGCCVALALSRLGFRVQLFDKSHALMQRASSNQEAKIHMGFVYAHDHSMITGRKMLEHALQFAPAMEWLVGGSVEWEANLSRRFYCGIHRDSNLSYDQHLSFFGALQEIFGEVSERYGRNYLGREINRIWHPETSNPFAGESMTHAVLTEETAVHPVWMRKVIVSAIDRDPNITLRVRHRIHDVVKNHQSLKVAGENGSGVWEEKTDLVVNCMWEGKHRIDKKLGFQADADWITRVKYGFVLESTPELRELPSLIITNGAFGDIVNYPSSNTIYITWYPACMTYIGKSDQLPELWDAACDGDHPESAKDVFDRSVDVLAEYVPQLRSLSLKQVMAGTIMGHGKTDITDRNSGLHRRHGIGVNNDGAYYSIFTGKYTSGPANAMELRKMLMS